MQTFTDLLEIHKRFYGNINGLPRAVLYTMQTEQALLFAQQSRIRELEERLSEWQRTTKKYLPSVEFTFHRFVVGVDKQPPKVFELIAESSSLSLRSKTFGRFDKIQKINFTTSHKIAQLVAFDDVGLRDNVPRFSCTLTPGLLLVHIRNDYGDLVSIRRTLPHDYDFGFRTALKGFLDCLRKYPIPNLEINVC